MVGWHHRRNGHEFGQTLGVGDGQGGLVCCGPWVTKSRTQLSYWTELSWAVTHPLPGCQGPLPGLTFLGQLSHSHSPAFLFLPGTHSLPIRVSVLRNISPMLPSLKKKHCLCLPSSNQNQSGFLPCRFLPFFLLPAFYYYFYYSNVLWLIYIYLFSSPIRSYLEMGTFLVAQGLRICLPMQKMWV